MKVGIDIENISRMSEKLLDKIATQKEREYVNSFADKKPRIASLWCAKEGVIKMLGAKEVSFLDIEILHTENGRPYVNLKGSAKTEFKAQGLTQIDISISHTDDLATAIVIAQ